MTPSQKLRQGLRAARRQVLKTIVEHTIARREQMGEGESINAHENGGGIRRD